MDLLVDQLVTNALLLPLVDSRRLLVELRQLNPVVSDIVEARLAELRNFSRARPQQPAARVESFELTRDHPVPLDLCSVSQGLVDWFLSQSLLLSCGAWFLRRRSLVAVAGVATGPSWKAASLDKMLATLIGLFRRPFVFSSSEQKKDRDHPVAVKKL